MVSAEPGSIIRPWRGTIEITEQGPQTISINGGANLDWPMRWPGGLKAALGANSQF